MDKEGLLCIGMLLIILSSCALIALAVYALLTYFNVIIATIVSSVCTLIVGIVITKYANIKDE